jgi:hypothetical protein
VVGATLPAVDDATLPAAGNAAAEPRGALGTARDATAGASAAQQAREPVAAVTAAAPSHPAPPSAAPAPPAAPMPPTAQTPSAAPPPRYVARASSFRPPLPAASRPRRPAARPDVDLDEPVFDLVVEAEQYAIHYPKRAQLIRRLGGLPPNCSFGPPEPDLVRAIVTGTTPHLRALDTEGSA